MRNNILTKDKCSDSDLEKLAIINEKLEDDEMKLDKMKDFNYVVLGMGIVAGLLLSIILKPQQTQPSIYATPNSGTAPVIYNIDNN